MKLNEYQELANKTASDVYNNIVTAPTMGLFTEAAEVADLIHKSVHHGKILDRAALKSELGDCLWNLAQLATFFGWDLGDIAQQNLDKLRERHGDKYNESHYRQMELATIPEGCPFDEQLNPIVAGEE